MRITSIRRFCSWPSRVSFDAMGSLAARPSALKRRPSLSDCASSLRTDSARASDRCQFEGKRTERIGTLSE